MDSVFAVKNINKEGFELYNLVNEKTYSPKSQIKMVNYRRVFKGSYLICNLITIEGEYYLSNVRRIIKSADSIEAYRAAVAMQMEDTSLIYRDNDEKLKEIKENVVFLAQKYKEFFKTGEIFTAKTKLNGLLDLFNQYTDGGEMVDYEEYTEPPETADIIVRFDPAKGLLTLPKEEKEPDKEGFSVPTILYSSGAFEKLMELSDTTRPEGDSKARKTGRNDPCLCGSGKKYKKCCL